MYMHICFWLDYGKTNDTFKTETGTETKSIEPSIKISINYRSPFDDSAIWAKKR